MTERRSPSAPVHHKLVRDRIPEIISGEGKQPVVRKLSGRELHEALGLKMIEEAHELFDAWQNSRSRDVLKESADVLEVMLKALSLCGHDLQDLLLEREKHIRERGAFSRNILLESVGDGGDGFPPEARNTPGFVFSPMEPDGLLRPTQSFTVFLQQLGRGLWTCEGKEFVVVIDFVGNFRKAHVAPWP